MNRQEYIEKLLVIYKLRYKPSEVEIAKFKLLLEMMPNDTVGITPPSPWWTKDDNDNPFPYPPITVMYGTGIPQQWSNGKSTTYSSSTTTNKKDE